MVILQLRPTKFNSLILIVYYIYTPNFSKRLFSSLFFKKSGEFHDNKNYRVYVKKPHHHLIYISPKFLKHYSLQLKKLGNPECYFRSPAVQSDYLFPKIFESSKSVVTLKPTIFFKLSQKKTKTTNFILSCVLTPLRHFYMNLIKRG